MFGDPAPAPTPPPLPEPLPAPPQYSAIGGQKAAGNTGKVAGFGSTLMTGPAGVDSSQTNTQRKSLLGQ